MTPNEEQGEQPAFTIEPGGNILLNLTAFAALYEPEYCSILYNQERHLLGIHGNGKFLVKRRSATQWEIQARGFFQDAGIILTATTYHQATVWPEVTAACAPVGRGALIADISEVVDEGEAFKELFLSPAPGEARS